MFDDKDLYEERDDLTAAEFDEVCQAVDDANTMYEKLRYLGTPKMPCMECGGTGTVGAGSLGDICPSCMGSRVMDHPAADDFDMPDFAAMRVALQKCIDKDNNLLPGAHRIPRLEAVNAMQAQGKQRANLLASAPAVPPPQLAARKKRPALGSLGDDEGGDLSDDELDELED